MTYYRDLNAKDVAEESDGGGDRADEQVEAEAEMEGKEKVDYRTIRREVVLMERRRAYLERCAGAEARQVRRETRERDGGRMTFFDWNLVVWALVFLVMGGVMDMLVGEEAGGWSSEKGGKVSRERKEEIVQVNGDNNKEVEASPLFNLWDGWEWDGESSKGNDGDDDNYDGSRIRFLGFRIRKRAWEDSHH